MILGGCIFPGVGALAYDADAIGLDRNSGRFADTGPLSAKWSHGCRHWQLSTRAHRVYAQRASDSLPLSLHVQRITARLAINAAMALTFVGAGHVAASGQREDAPLRQSAVSCRRREGAQGCRLLGESSG
jgi:hypothetical protein